MVQVCKSLSLLSNLHLLGEQQIRPCFFPAYPHCYPFYQFDFITSSWKNSFQPSSSCPRPVHLNLKTSKMCFLPPPKKKILIFCHTLRLLCASAGAVPYIRTALGDNRGQKHSSSAPIAPVGMRCGFVPAAMHVGNVWGSFSSSRLPDTSLLHGAEAGSPWRQQCPCWPWWAALLRSEDNISPENFCALCSSLLNAVGVTMSAHSMACVFQCLLNRNVYWQDCKLKLVVLWRNPLLCVRGHHLASHHHFCRCQFVSVVIYWLGGRISVQ